LFKLIKILVPACLIVLFSAASSYAATISRDLKPPMIEMGCYFMLEGIIAEGDAKELEKIAYYENVEKFEDIQDKYMLSESGWNICLNSAGGSYLESVKLAETISKAGLGTVVSVNDKCEGACAIAFLGGSYFNHEMERGRISRKIHATASLGFHAPSLNIRDGLSYTAETVSKAYNFALQAVLTLSDMRQSGYEIPESLFRAIVATPPTEIHYVDTVGKALEYKIGIVGIDASAEEVNTAAYNICSNAVNPIAEWRDGNPNIEFRFVGRNTLHAATGFLDELSSDCSISIGNKFEVSFGFGYNDVGGGSISLPLFSSLNSNKKLRSAYNEKTISRDEFLLKASKLQDTAPKSCAVERKNYVTNVENFTNLREQPGLNGKIIDKVSYGTGLFKRLTGYYTDDFCHAACESTNQNAINSCIENNHVWIEFFYNGNVGFLSRKFLSTREW
jgi:hypothetical protein